MYDAACLRLGIPNDLRWRKRAQPKSEPVCPLSDPCFPDPPGAPIEPFIRRPVVSSVSVRSGRRPLADPIRYGLVQEGQETESRSGIARTQHGSGGSCGCAVTAAAGTPDRRNWSATSAIPQVRFPLPHRRSGAHRPPTKPSRRPSSTRSSPPIRSVLPTRSAMRRTASRPTRRRSVSPTP